MPKFRAKLEPVPHGGQYVVVPAKIAEQAGLAHGARVRGTVRGVPYRSSLMKYSGIFHLGVHKAVLAEAGAEFGQRIELTLERDDQPLPSDVVPDDLARMLARNPKARAAFAALRSSLRREYVQSIVSAKKAETRARRLQKVIGLLRSPPARTNAGS